MAFGSHLEGDSLRATLDSAERTPERRFDVWILPGQDQHEHDGQGLGVLLFFLLVDGVDRLEGECAVHI